MGLFYLPLTTAAARMKKRFIDAPQNGGEDAEIPFMPLPRDQMTENYFANLIIGCVSVVAMKPVEGGFERCRVYSNATHNLYVSDGGSTIQCGGNGGGTYEQVLVSRLAAKLVELDYAFSCQYIERRLGFPVIRRLITAAVVSRMLSLLNLGSGLRSSAWFSQPGDRCILMTAKISARPTTEESDRAFNQAVARWGDTSNLFKIDDIRQSKKKKYEWKLADEERQKSARSVGWVPVLKSRNRKVYSDDKRVIRRGGMVLMEISADKYNELEKLGFERGAADLRAVADTQLKDGFKLEVFANGHRRHRR